MLLVFVDEALAMVALGVWGWHVQGVVLAVAAPAAAVYVWYTFASPKARHGKGWRRPVAKVVVFVLASLALWASGHAGWAVALLVFSVVINALAQLPAARAVVAAERGADASFRVSS